jgi:hypothetical protein
MALNVVFCSHSLLTERREFILNGEKKREINLSTHFLKIITLPKKRNEQKRDREKEEKIIKKQKLKAQLCTKKISCC